MTTDLQLDSPLWRLCNLYSIKREDTGKILPFTPRPEQLEVITSLIDRPAEPLFIIKSRRLGMSTAIGLAMADRAAWNNGFQGSLVDQTQSDAERKMSEIIRFGVLSMPPAIVERLQFPKRNDGELQISPRDTDDATLISRIFAGKNARGGTNNFLWISEWGPIAATDPTRSKEIRTGALPSARLGSRVIETTWYGGKGGDLWELVKPILEHDPNAMGRVLFFPWHGDPSCVRTAGMVSGELEEYFRDLGDRLGKSFSEDQKRWYAAAKLEQGIYVKREYPSTLEEAMTAPIEGAIYGDDITRLRSEGAIKPFAVDSRALVHTFWDEGSPINTVAWYVQFVSDEIRIIDCDLDLELTPVERTAHMLRKPYAHLYGAHYLTHASMQTEKSGKTFAAQLKEAGLQSIKVVPRTQDVWIGINECLQLMPRMIFRLPSCEVGLSRLEVYHTRRASSSGIAQDEPVHDFSSHAADALRTLAEASMMGMIPGGSSIARSMRKGNRPVRVITGINGVADRPRMAVIR
jgi:hypothetical protein